MWNRRKEEWREIALYCQEYWREEVEHILRVADEVCRNYFLFDLKWDMERTYEPVIFEEEIDWAYMPGEDPEFIFQMNRHRFFICLGQAYHLTGDEKYVEHFLRMLLDWIDKVEMNDYTKARQWRILEAGIRAENWIKAMSYMKSSSLVTEEIVEKFYRSLRQHAEFIIQMHSPYRYMSNWGVIENHGLFLIGAVYPDKEIGKHYMDSAMEYLLTEAHMQIMPDGVQWEQSPMYHNEVLHCFIELYRAILEHEINVSVRTKEILLETIRKMAYANLKWAKPNHHQVLMGDSDDTDLRDMIGVCAYLLKDPVLKYGGYDRMDYEHAWDFGVHSIKSYEKLASIEPDFMSVALEHSGNYYLRNSWREDANYLHFHNGTQGAGHGHSDKLHVDLVYAGEDVLVDAGRYTYVVGPDRFFFKNPDMHNTITVDKQFFCICKDSWECSKLTQPVKQGFYTSEHYDFVQGGHLGYMDEANGVFVNRKVIYIKPDIFLLVDEMYGGGTHEYQQYFHFNEEGEVQIEENTVVYEGPKAKAQFTFISEGVQINRMHSNISRNYNQRVKNEAVEVSRYNKGFTSVITVIHGGKKDGFVPADVEKVAVNSALKGIVYPDAMAEGIKIRTKEKEYTVIVCHQEVNSPTDMVQVGECYGYGSVLVFDEWNGPLRGQVLCW